MFTYLFLHTTQMVMTMMILMITIAMNTIASTPIKILFSEGK